MGLFFSNQKEIDHVSEVVNALNDKTNKIAREMSLITGDTCVFHTGEEKHDNLKKLRADIEKLTLESRRARESASLQHGEAYNAFVRFHDTQLAIINYLGCEVVTDPAKSATIKLVKKGKK